MPTIMVEGPPFPDLDRKRTFVRKLTDAAVEAYEIKNIVVLIRENAPENVAVNGTLICDRKKE